MTLSMVCASHTPLMRDGRASEQTREQVMTGYRELRDFIEHFDPEVLVQFSPDHFNGFFYDLMPAFCIGTAAESVGDWHTSSGPLNVPEVAATELARGCLAAGIDMAVSYRMRVDHGFTQIWDCMFGGLPKQPLIPIFINCAAPPLPTFRRARELGAAVGQMALTWNKRVLVVASGGLSHDPPTPQLSTASPEMRERLIDGRHPTAEVVGARQRRVLEAGESVLRGEQLILPVSAAWDQSFLEELRAGDPTAFDRWRVEDVVSRAGRGGTEVLCWVAAVAALGAAGPCTTQLHFYEAIQGWIAGMAMLTGSPVISIGDSV